MKFPGGNPLLFCEQVSTVTSFFEQWNDCERTVVLYALLKRVPFANLKFLQLSIDYNLAQNYSTQSKLQLLESHANNANFLNQLVQRYQTSGDVPATNGLTSCSDSGFQESSKEKKSSSTFDLSGGSSASSTTSSSSTSSTASDPAAKCTAGGVDNKSAAESATVAPGHQESKKDILNDMLVYLPLLKPGNDDVKSVYMSLIPAAVEDACQRAVPTELVQHILSYLLIHPAVNNDDRRSLSYWLRHLEEHIASSYMTTLATPSLAAAATANNSNNNSSNSKLATVNNNNNNYFTQQSSKPGSQQSLQFLAATATPWHHLHPQQQQQPAPPAAIGSSSSSSLLSISNSSLLSKSQQSLNQSGGAGPGGGGGGGGGGSSTSSSSSGLDSGASQLKSAGSGGSHSSANNSSSTTASTTMMVNLDWTTSTQTAEVGGEGVKVRGSMENVTLKEFGPVTFNYPRDHHQQQQLSSQAVASSQALNGGSSAVAVSNNATLNGSAVGAATTTAVATTAGSSSVLTDLDSSSDDNHLSFSKNGTEIFDYDCDYDNEEELYNLARAAAAAAVVAGSGVSGAAGSAMTPGGSTAGSGKNRVSFDANISDYLRVPPIGDLELDGSGLLKTRRSNSLTTSVGSGCGLVGVGGELHHQQKQNNECLSAENLSQLMQNKPRSFSLTMESPRSSLTSSGSETRLDDFKQHHHMMKMYGTAPNVGMASIAHWLKSLRLHKYVWLFSNLTYEQMMEMTEEYLASLGVTKGARHKLVLCIQKLRERYVTMVRLEKELLAAGSVGSKTLLGAVFEELTNIVLTPMKPVGSDPREDIGTQFLKLLDLIASILLVRSAVSPQDEEFLNVYVWLLERAMHNEAFAGHVLQLKEYKYKANKVKMQFGGGPKGGGGGAGGAGGLYGKIAGMGGGLGGSGGLGGMGGVGLGGERGMQLNGNLGKPRWSVSNKHNKPCGGSSEGLQKAAPHRKSSLQYFSSPMQQQPGQPNPSGGGSSSSHTHLQAIPPHGYYGGAGTGHNNSYNKSSSYPNFASNLSESAKHHRGHPAQVPHPHQVPVPPVPPQQQQQQPPHVPPHGNFMYHRHSLNNISAHQHQQQFLQQLQSQQQQQSQQLLPSIYLTTMGGGGGAVAKKELPLKDSQQQQQQKSDDSGKSQNNNNNNNSIGDINSRLEFLCLQMTEQAIN
ncbi:protein Smaug [Culex pipiens pallens]|uniref:protein Smaug n=1 Tax=Culex pipiens pallens TaxID=42434 RepID=UPI0019530778|nr:protein Smaug [Culex pipiens pallens]XP_052566262.1 protein Smaug [Culex pipiens pallens]